MKAPLTLMTAPLSVVAGGAVALYIASQTPVAERGFTALPAASFAYQKTGEFTKDGKPVSNPTITVKVAAFAIMNDLVSVGEFKRCIAESACPANRDVGDNDSHPAINVSWRDASAYAAWLSRKTGKLHRLPTDEEWSYAAAERAPGEAPAVQADDPSERWLKRYDEEYSDKATDTATKPLGGFGRNSRGLNDLGGNVWEWTDSCYTRHNVDSAATITNCGVRVVEGRHRAYVTDFIRDAKSGGCSAGKPPTNLGFRLVREQRSGADWLMAGLKDFVGR